MKTIEIFEGPRAQTYDQSIRVWCPDYDFIHALLPSILQHQLGHSNPGEILVVGSGTGTEIINLLRFDEAWRVTGVDPSPEMMSQAGTKLKSFNDHKYDLVTGTVADLTLEKKYDAAISILVLQFLPDNGAKLQLLQEVALRLKKGGTLVFVDIFGEGESFARNLSLLHAFLSHKGLEPNVVQNGIRHIREDLFPISQERLSQLLSEAGFGVPHIFTQSLLFGGWIGTKLD